MRYKEILKKSCICQLLLLCLHLNKLNIMITKTEDRRAKRVEAVESNRKKNPVLNRNKAWKRRRTT